MEQRGPVGGWKMKHLHSGPGNEGVFLRDDSSEEDQRERGKTQRLSDPGEASTTLIPDKLFCRDGLRL